MWREKESGWSMSEPLNPTTAEEEEEERERERNVEKIDFILRFVSLRHPLLLRG